VNIKNYFLIVNLICLTAFGADVLSANNVESQRGATATDPFALRCMAQDKIDAHQHKIAKTILWHSLIRTTAKVGGTAVFLYVAYRSLRSMLAPEFSDDKRLVNYVPTEQEYAAFKQAHAGPFTFQWWKNNALWIMNSMACTTALSVGAHLIGRYNHDDNIEWFVQENTRIKGLSDELHAYYGQLLAKNAVPHEVSAQDLHNHRVTLAGIARDLVAQAESVTGFMEYRLAYFKNQRIVLLPDEFLQPTRLVASMNEFVHSLQQILPVQEQHDSLEQVKKVCSKVMQCATDLQQIINRFQGIEYSIQWRIINGG